jgi:2-oxo-4-hydroxy-4-carboxy-5-ureidoimidazoline decarboxylase
VQLSNFNAATIQEVQQLLMQMVHIPDWAVQLQQLRPFASKEQLLQQAEQLADTWTWPQIAAALATHPRIGEKQAQAQLSAKEQDFSAAEQAAIAQDQSTQAALLAGNLAYEAQFDFIFLIRAAGRSSDEILAALEQRLHHDLATEQQVVHQQLKEIALLRLAQEIGA